MESGDVSEQHCCSRHKILEYTTELLDSAMSRDLFVFEKKRSLRKIWHYFDSIFLKQYSSHNNLVDVLCATLKFFNIANCTRQYNANLRQHLIAVCSKNVTSTLSWCKTYLHMSIKQNELRYVTWGIIYMMRLGVSVQNVTVIAQISELNSVLINESQISRFLGFKAKHITDVENKFKFAFRNMKTEDLLRISQHTAKAIQKLNL